MAKQELEGTKELDNTTWSGPHINTPEVKYICWYYRIEYIRLPVPSRIPELIYTYHTGLAEYTVQSGDEIGYEQSIRRDPSTSFDKAGMRKLILTPMVSKNTTGNMSSEAPMSLLNLFIVLPATDI
jgi:hypothetical protein